MFYRRFFAVVIIVLFLMPSMSFIVSASIPQQGMRVVGERQVMIKGKLQDCWIIHNSENGDIWGVDMYGGIDIHDHFNTTRLYPWFGGNVPAIGATGAYNFNGSFLFDNDFIVAIIPTKLGDVTNVKWVLTDKNASLGQISSNSDFTGSYVGDIGLSGAFEYSGRATNNYEGTAYETGLGKVVMTGVEVGDFYADAYEVGYENATNIFPYHRSTQEWLPFDLHVGEEILLYPVYNRVSSKSVLGVDGVPAIDVILFPVPSDLAGIGGCYVQADIKLLVPKSKVPNQYVGGFFVTGAPNVVSIQKDAEEQEIESLLKDSGGGLDNMKKFGQSIKDTQEFASESTIGEYGVGGKWSDSFAYLGAVLGYDFIYPLLIFVPALGLVTVFAKKGMG